MPLQNLFLEPPPELEEKKESPSLLDLMRQRGEEQMKSAKAPESEEEKLESLSDSFLRGFINRASAKGEAPPAQIFEQRFRNSVSPAREFLANLFYGMSSGLSGERFRSARQRQIEEFVTMQKLEQEQEETKQRFQLSVANMLQETLRERQQARTRMDIEAMRALDKKADRDSRFVQFLATHGLNQERFNQLKEFQQAQMNRQRDPLMDFGFQEAMTEMASLGKDPMKPEHKTELFQRAAQIGNQLYAERQKIQAKHQPLTPKYESVRVTNPWGQLELGVFDKTSGKIVHGPEWWSGAPRDVSTEELRRFQLTQSSIDGMRRAIQVVANNPEDAVGGFEKSVPPEIRAIFTSVPAAERNVRFLFNSAVSNYILGQSGVATSGREEKRLAGGLPRFYEKPSNFVPGALAFSNALEAVLLRQQAGISPQDLDLGSLMDDYLTNLQKHLQDAEKRKVKPNFRVPTATEFLEQAAAEKKVKLLRDNFGRIRGISR